MHEIEEFILKFDGNQNDVLRYLHSLITSYDGVKCSIKFRIPFYFGRSWLCYLNPVKNNGTELVFTRGVELSQMFPILEKKSRKIVAGITFYHLNEIPELEIAEILTEALRLDAVKGNPFSQSLRNSRGKTGKNTIT